MSASPKNGVLSMASSLSVVDTTVVNTPRSTLTHLTRLVGRKPEHVLVDMHYRGHGFEGKCTVHVDKRHRGRLPKSTWR